MTTKHPDTPEAHWPPFLEPVRRLWRRLSSIPWLRRTLRVLGITIGRLSQDDGWAMASHLALSALMALFPFLIFVAAAAGLLFGNAQLAEEATALLFDTWPEPVAAPIAREVENVLTSPRAGVITISILVTIYLASNGVEAVRAALSRAYGTEQQRTFLFLRLQSLGFVLLGTVACLALALLGVLGPLLFTLLQRLWPWLADQGGAFQAVRYVVVGTLLTGALVAAHSWLPGRRWQGIRIWPGIVATLSGWWLATISFASYLESFANYVSTYAGLAGIVTALFYLYIMSVILIFGAELNAAIARTSPRATRARTEKTKKRGRIAPPRPPSFDD